MVNNSQRRRCSGGQSTVRFWKLKYACSLGFLHVAVGKNGTEVAELRNDHKFRNPMDGKK
jgi:hypothetical protein